jgi:hypothetical protein
LRTDRCPNFRAAGWGLDDTVFHDGVSNLITLTQMRCVTNRLRNRRLRFAGQLARQHSKRGKALLFVVQSVPRGLTRRALSA